MNYTDLIKTHQQKIVLALGFVLIGAISFGLGRISAIDSSAPEIKVEQAFAAPDNYTLSASVTQSSVSGQTVSKPNSILKCDGKIKGSSSMIYHMPGGSFYDRTTKPIRCFDSEAQAVSAGFRKSSK